MEPVALRKESVDRNSGLAKNMLLYLASLSARRAWIEMVFPRKSSTVTPVALRKESVDRNTAAAKIIRRVAVALRKESVDRNKPADADIAKRHCRSPQGERG